MTTPKVFYDLVNTWRDGIADAPKIANGVFRGITNFMPGYWNIVGVTRNAYALMESRGWQGNFAKDLRRDHIKSGRAFQQHLHDSPVSYAEFCDLIADYGRCIVCTKGENPARTAGYGNTYTDADILWLAEPVDTSTSIAIPITKAMAAAFKAGRG